MAGTLVVVRPNGMILKSLKNGLEMRVMLDSMLEEPGLDVRAERRPVGLAHSVQAIGECRQALQHRAMLGDVNLDRRIRDRAKMARCGASVGLGSPNLRFQFAQNGVLGSQVGPGCNLYGIEVVGEPRSALARVSRGAEPPD